MKYNLNNRISESSIALLALAQCPGPCLLGLMTIVALGQVVFSIIVEGSVHLGNLLLLFIYLEVLTISLVAIRYWKNAKKPNAGQNQPTQS